MACTSCTRRVLPVSLDALWAGRLPSAPRRSSRAVRCHNPVLARVASGHRALHRSSGHSDNHERYETTQHWESHLQLESNGRTPASQVSGTVSIPSSDHHDLGMNQILTRDEPESELLHGNGGYITPRIKPDRNLDTARHSRLGQWRGSLDRQNSLSRSSTPKALYGDAGDGRIQGIRDTARDPSARTARQSKRDSKAFRPPSRSLAHTSEAGDEARQRGANMQNVDRDAKRFVTGMSESAGEPWRVQKLALKAKFKDEGWNPRKRLSPEALEGIRALHAQYPNHFTTPALAEQFKVSPEAIRRILKSKWRPNEEEERKRLERWDKRGEKIWTQKVEEGIHPPKKWREMGIGIGPRRKAQQHAQQSSARDARHQT